MTESSNPEHHQRLVADDHRHVWHPFTPMSSWLEKDPVIIQSAHGCWLEDTQGRRYLDGVSSLWVNVHGHRHPHIDQAVARQLRHIAHSTLLGLSNVPSIQLAARLAQYTPSGLTKVFYSDNGSTAVEVALKMAFQYWHIKGSTQRREFVALDNAYHGDTIGAVSVGGIPLFHTLFRPLLFDVHRFPSPHWYRSGSPEDSMQHSLHSLKGILEQRGDHIAALIIEPLVQGAAGMIVHPSGFLRRVSHLCRQYDVLLVCDEVATAFGRTGTMFASEQEEVVPDFLALAKGLTGGYLPVAATITSQDIFEVFSGADPSIHTFFHGHTYTGNPLGCAAALASLEIFETDHVLQSMPPRIELLEKSLRKHVEPLPHCGQIRQKGFMVGIELVENRSTKKPFPPNALIGSRVCLEARNHGVILRPLGDVIVLMPPLCINEEELELLASATARAITHVTEQVHRHR